MPLLADIYLHYALDPWFEKVYRKSRTGFARLIRYADDFVVCFQNKPDAERFREELRTRLGTFGLEVEPTKTTVMEFGRFAVQNAKGRGKRAATFDFLGFTRYCGTKRDGKATTEVWLRCCGTAGKPGGNGEHKHRPTALGETDLLDCSFVV